MEESDSKNGIENLFKDVTFYIVGDISEQVVDLLSKYGGKRDAYLSQMVSHVIADDVENHEYQEARELFELPCVMSDWVLMSVKCKKLLDKEIFAPEGRLFSGIVVCASMLSESDWLLIWGMVVYYGGRCEAALTSKCTHLITTAAEGAKYIEALKREDTVKIVTPDWVADSVGKGERLDESTYHPRLIVYPKPPSPPRPFSPLKQEPAELSQDGMKLLHVPSSSTDRRSPMEFGGYASSRPGTPGSASTKEALAKLVNNRKQDLPLPRQQTMNVAGASGQYPVSPSHHPGMQVSMHPSRSPAPQSFPNPGPHVANFGHPLHPGASPRAQSLHPPGLNSPHNAMVHQQQAKLRNITNSVENHKQQQVRHPLQHKVGFPPGAGQQLPKHPPPGYYQQNVLGPPGQQQQQQQMWPQYWGHDPTDSVPPELCLLGCIFYINDYPKLLGPEQVNVWKKVIEQHGGQVDLSYSNRVTHVLCANQKTDVFQLALRDQRRTVSAFWLNDVLLKKKLLPPWQALHLPLLYSEDGQRPCSNQIISITNFEGDDRTRVKQMISALGAKYTGYMTRANSVLVCKYPEGTKYQKAKEWQIDVVNIQWLSDLILGHMDALRKPVQPRYLQVRQGDEFQMDLSKVQHLMAAWRNPLKVSKEIWKRFSPSLKKNSLAMGQENVQNIQSPKKFKLEPNQSVDLNAPGPRVLFTGFPKGLTRLLQSMIIQLGGAVVEHPQQCTHLVAQSFSRTMKFFVAINVCHHIVSKQWVEESHRHGNFLIEGPYILHDPAGEVEMKCSLAHSLNRARTRPLFAGLTFFITPSVQPPVCDLKMVVESAGGTFSRKPRLPAKKLESLVDDQNRPTYIVVTCAEDIHLCEDLINYNIRLYTSEFILTGVMRQELDYHHFLIDVQR